MSAREGDARLDREIGAGDHVSGAADAPLTLVEYGDYECGHCGRAYPIVRHLQKRFGPRLRFVFRNFPLSQLHAHAELAAEAAEAAAAQGRFWEMHEALFVHHFALERPDLVKYATRIGLDAERVAAELETRAHRARVRADFLSGVHSGVNGTPTFFVNGVRWDGAWEHGELEAALASAP